MYIISCNSVHRHIDNITCCLLTKHEVILTFKPLSCNQINTKHIHVLLKIENMCFKAQHRQKG